ncbi:MAG: hypothetical protein AABX29_03455 [Nanoarchaeota archaeon]
MDQAEINDLERNFLKIIIENIKSKKMTLDDARKMAKDFMNLLPFKDQNDFKFKIKNFTNKYTMFSSLYITILKNEESLKMNTVINKMRVYMKEKNIDEALKVVNQ